MGARRHLAEMCFGVCVLTLFDIRTSMKFRSRRDIVTVRVQSFEHNRSIESLKVAPACRITSGVHPIPPYSASCMP